MYEEYHELLRKFKEADRCYNESLEEKSKLILSVLPQATKIKESLVSGGYDVPDAKILNYTSKIDEVDKLINSSRNTRDMLNYELKKKEREMRASTDVLDRVYIFYWIEKRKIREFYRLIGYSKAQTYRFVEEIKENLYQKIKNEKK